MFVYLQSIIKIEQRFDTTCFHLNSSLVKTFSLTNNVDELKNGVFWVNGYETKNIGTLPFTNDHIMIIQYEYNNTVSIQVAISMNTPGTNGIKKRFYQNASWDDWRI